MKLQIDIVSDTICPWCYIGHARLVKALGQRPDLEASLAWHPFELNPAMPKEGLAREDYIRQVYGEAGPQKGQVSGIREAALEEGLEFAIERAARIPNTVASHRLLRWAGEAGCQTEVALALFRRYFGRGENIGDPGMLAAAAGECGMDAAEMRAALETDKDEAAVRQEALVARSRGVNGVPTFLFNRKYMISGALPPDYFLQVFAAVEAREKEEAAGVSAG